MYDDRRPVFPRWLGQRPRERDLRVRLGGLQAGELRDPVGLRPGGSGHPGHLDPRVPGIHPVPQARKAHLPTSQRVAVHQPRLNLQR